MVFTHCIAHGVSRHGPRHSVELTLREQPLQRNGYLDEMLRELKHVFVGKAGKQYGQFHPDAGTAVVAQWLREFRDDKMSFAAFTRKSTEHLQSLLANTEIVVDGHLIFALESLEAGDSLYVFMASHSEAVYLDGQLNLEVSRFIDTSGVLLGARIDIGCWQTDAQESYLAVLRARGDRDLTEQFWNWIGFADQRDIGAETVGFLEAVSAFADTMEDEEARSYRHKVVDFCLQQDKQGEAVRIDELSAHLDEEQPQRFARFIEEQSDTPASLFPERRQLKQFVRISGRNEMLSMSFAAECLGDSVVYDKQEDQLIIRNIPAPLKLRLIKHLQEAEGNN